MREETELQFKSRRPTAHRRHDPWFAWAMLLIGALALSNAAWFYNWRERTVAHADELAAARSSRATAERVVYEYRQARPAPTTTPTRHLETNEECRGGIVIRRSGNAIESTGEHCK